MPLHFLLKVLVLQLVECFSSACPAQQSLCFSSYSLVWREARTRFKVLEHLGGLFCSDTWRKDNGCAQGEEAQIWRLLLQPFLQPMAAGTVLQELDA